MRILSLCLLFLILGCSRPSDLEGPTPKFYRSPMHPWITSDQPGNCTICGMKLVPVYEGDKDAPVSNAITLTPASQRALRVATVPVREMEMTKLLRFSGILEDNDNLHRIIAAFYDGRIDQVYIDHVGQYVKKGQPLAAIYSPELLYIVREYQNAVRGRNAEVAKNSAQRLVQYGLSTEQIDSLAKQPDSVYTINLLAPISGTVLVRNAFQGQYIKTGEPLFEMGDLARLWFHAEVYERDLSNLSIGQRAILTSPTVPGRKFAGVVTFIDPNFDPVTRSTQVRIEVDNPILDEKTQRRLLPHRAYAEADVFADLGKGLVVPKGAVLRDGRRSVVYVEVRPGEYEQRSVNVGRVTEEGIEIAGVKAGERVVTEGNLMIDAESQIRHFDQPGNKPTLAQGELLPAEGAFLRQLAEVSQALAEDDLTRALQAAQSLGKLAVEVNPEWRALPAMSGSDLKAVRQAFLPWSMAGAELTLQLRQKGTAGSVRVFECPMTSDSFPGAPAKARWVEMGGEVRNPYHGAAMLTCGSEVSE